MGAVHGLAIVLAFLVWLASLIALVVLPIQFLQARRANQRQEPVPVRQRVRTIDRFRAAARMVSWGPRRARQMDGISQQHTAYRPGPQYPGAQQRPPREEPTRRQPRVNPNGSRSQFPNGPQSQYPNWSGDPERKYRTLQSIAAVQKQQQSQPQPDWRGGSTRERRAQQPPPPQQRDRRDPYDPYDPYGR